MESPASPIRIQSGPALRHLRRVVSWAWLLIELVIISALILGARCANYEDVFVGGKIYFIDADCYSRMTRARMVAQYPGLIVRHQDFENYPAGTTPHTTAPLDYLIVGLAALLKPFSARAFDLAGALVSPLLAVFCGWFLCCWSRWIRLPFRWAGLLLFAVSPILAHGTALGRPDHQSLLIVLVLVALAAEWTLQQKPSRGWSLTSGLSWGLALWVSLYEPLLLLAVLTVALACARRAHPLAGWRSYALAGVLILAALVERRWPHLPGAEWRTWYSQWSTTIGELKPISLTSPIWWPWFGGWSVLTPILLLIAAAQRKVAPWLVTLFLLTFALTLWQVRWSYFFAAIFCLTIPALLAVVRPRWLGRLAATLAFLPFLQTWDAEIWPNEQRQTARAEARLEAAQWRTLAETLPRDQVAPFLAPWWLSPAAVYWSGQPAIAGSSHESLPGIVASARFFASTEPNEARALIASTQVRWVLAYDGERTAKNCAAILNQTVTRRALCFTLDRAPSQAPDFLSLTRENGAGKVYRVRP